MNQEKIDCRHPGCKENPLKSSKEGLCIFHARPEEKDITEFHKDLENYVNRIKAKDLDYKFMGFIFVGDTDFRSLLNQSVSKNVSFEAAEFHGTARFDGLEFQKDFLFIQAQFYHADASFRKAKFHGETRFDNAHFEYADFVSAEFHGETHFWATHFGKKGAHFMKAKFTARAYFSCSHIGGEISFASAILENISLTPLKLGENARIDFTDARLRNTQIQREDIADHILQEREEYFSQAKEVYLLLKNNFHSLGRYDDESWAFTKEKDMERKSYRHFIKEYMLEELGPKWKNKGIKYCLYPALLDYEYSAKYLQDHWLPISWKNLNRLFSCMLDFSRHPIASLRAEFRNLASFVATNKRKRIGEISRGEICKVLCSSTKYLAKYYGSTLLKYLYRWGEWPWLIFPWCGGTIFFFSLLYLSVDIITRDGVLVKSYLSKLYFSGVTFTALGYGDYSPLGWARPLAFLESFLGIFLIALFVFSFARRTAGR